MQPSEMTNDDFYFFEVEEDQHSFAFLRDYVWMRRQIAELRERIKIAEDALTELQTRLVSSVYDGTMNPYEALEITERAIAAISEKGGAK